MFPTRGAASQPNCTDFRMARPVTNEPAAINTMPV